MRPVVLSESSRTRRCTSTWARPIAGWAATPAPERTWTRAGPSQHWRTTATAGWS